MKYMRPYRWYFIFGMLCLSLSSVMFMLFPAAAGEMANTAAGKSKYNYTINQYGLFFIVLLIAQGILSYGRSIALAVVSERGVSQVRQDLYAAMITQPVSFFESNKVGELTSRITGDVEQLQNVFSVTLAEFIRQLITLVVGIAILAYVTPKLSLIMLATFPVIVLLAIFFGRYIRKLSKERQAEVAISNSIAEESLHSFNVVKAFTNELFEMKRYNNVLDKVVKISLDFARVKGLFFIFIITVLFGGIFFILWQGALLVQSGQMAIGDLFSFIIYTGIIGGAIASLGTFYTQLAGALGATDRILEIMESTPELDHKTNSIESPAAVLHGDIELKNVRFHYPSRPENGVLNGINMHIEKGSKVALVGASGAGKSTIVSMLMRFHDPISGEITIGGVNIKDYDLHAFRKNFATVPQDVILFGGTIRENIAYGKPEASDAEIMEAAEKANAMQFISSFHEGLDTVVGDRGIRLSGGQKQRIAIARAILRDPKFLILDEATSSLDAESEHLVQDALNTLMEGRTSLIIAHRLATIVNVDKIYVLNDGQVIEEGTHNELMSVEDGWYRYLASMQMTKSALV
ncbi:MAG: ATP-binding cassette domain-containing protein [Saprospiraceae bacterium]|nr:ATP-binding cassette domain-containing protein [Candidatus Brachybacter algidus]MBK8357315.1 ATP-binding cassette domain-containing protein [Candidatus Brachybacter algidus]